jgi:hypothetical protein
LFYRSFEESLLSEGTENKIKRPEGSFKLCWFPLMGSQA